MVLCVVDYDAFTFSEIRNTSCKCVNCMLHICNSENRENDAKILKRREVRHETVGSVIGLEGQKSRLRGHRIDLESLALKTGFINHL